MLRGSSRHDGIPNKQSARERDRDRLREKQRQERQQMLPNDEKEIIVGAQDLFHAPVKVKPSVDDSTSAQIANTLGNFDTVRHLIIDNASSRGFNLIGVDQGSLPRTPVSSRQPPQSLATGHSENHNSSNKSSHYPASSYSSSQQKNSSDSSVKSHHRPYPLSSASGTNSTNNSTSTSNSLTNNSSSDSYNYQQSSGYSSSFRSSSGNSQQKGGSQSQSSHPSGHGNALLAPPPPPPPSGGQSHSNLGGGGSLTNSYGNSASNSNQVRQTALNVNNNSSNNNGSSASANSAPPTAVTEVSGEDRFSSANKTATNALLVNTKDSFIESVSGADDKNSRHASSNRKPALERADSQLEIESMLKEMMDVTAPLTAIQTPVKENPAKKLHTQRRSSKSEERISVQSILGEMADVPSTVQRMDSSGDSSSSYDSETSDSESEDSSSGSQTGGEKVDATIPKITPNTPSPTRWGLGAFIQRRTDANATNTLGAAKSPKDTKPNANQVNAINSETSPGDAPAKTDSIVSSSSTSHYNKSQSLSPLDTPVTAPPVTRKTTRSSGAVEPKTELHPPPKPPASTNSSKSNSTNNPVNKSLSSSSSEEEPVKGKKDAGSKGSSASVVAENDNKSNSVAGAGKRKRKRSSSSTERSSAQQPKGGAEEASIESVAGAAAAASAATANGKKNKNIVVSDRNKNETLLKVFRGNNRKDSPTQGDTNELGKSPSSVAAPNTNGTGLNSGSLTLPGGSGSAGGSSGSNSVALSGSTKSNRVQAKDSGKKSKSSETSGGSNDAHNGETEPNPGLSGNEKSSKRRGEEGTTSREKDSSSSSSSRTSHGKKNQKSAGPVQGSSSGKSSSSSSSHSNASVLLPPPPPPAVKGKDDAGPSKDKMSMMSSSLVVKIQLNKLKRKPSLGSTSMPAPMPPPPALLPPPPPPIKVEKESSSELKGAKTIKEPPGASISNADPCLKRVHHNSSRVGSSSDHAKDAKETVVVAHNPPPGRPPPDASSLCSEKDLRTKKRSKSKKVKSSSPKKTKTKHEPDSHSKVEDETACGEVSSNVLGFSFSNTPCDSVSVSTTRTPPVESDLVQAPDSSLNPPHLPSPVVPPQPVYYSYFEKTDHLEDYCNRDQDSYLEEAKRLKHKADGERVSTTQASVYLEAGLYFILTGISMERDRTVGSTAAFTMYKDTLVLIRYIGSRFRNRGADFSNPVEAKIIVLSMRCQSMLSYRLFKIKMRETKDMVQYLQDHFQRHPTIELPPVISSPQLSTPSPHSPTSSPAASSSLHPSPHHHPTQIMTTIPRNLYSNMQKTCGSAMNLIGAHELWDNADMLVEKYHLEDFFIQLDRQLGPLTLHNTLVDLVRYVKQALQIIKTTDLS